MAAVVAMALFLRTYRLGSIPDGLHGDEAIAGLEGQHILRDGWIGPYSPFALGQPAGPLYLVAPAVALFGNTVFAVRLVPAVMGTLTVLTLYLAARGRFGRRAALVATIVLATMGWHLLFTRTGFPVGSWPLVTLLAAWAFSTAVGRESFAWYAVAGGLAGAGIYVYNAHYVVIAAFALIIIAMLVARRHHPLRRDLLCAGAFTCGLIIATLPMARFAAKESNGYFQHFRHETGAGTPSSGAQRTPLEQAGHWAGQYGETWMRLTLRPKIEGVDGSGIVPILPVTLAALAVAGAAVSLRRWPGEPLIWIGITVVAVAPVAPAITGDGGVARRTLEMTPFVAMFAAISLSEAARFIERRGRHAAWQAAGGVAMTGLIALCGWQGVVPYFTRVADSPAEQWIYAPEFTDAARFMATLQPGDYVYLATDRQSINYETRQFLAPHVQGEDIGPKDPAERFEYHPARGRPVFILLGSFRADVPELEREHPGGALSYGPAINGSPAFIAYELPQP